ncbi:MAG: hypothetical protein K5989_05720 [Lachnospiraceae bacterium]|nr:hypothetical protein [Lachnospiraceae bacterium]
MGEDRNQNGSNSQEEGTQSLMRRGEETSALFVKGRRQKLEEEMAAQKEAERLQEVERLEREAEERRLRLEAEERERAEREEAARFEAEQRRREAEALQARQSQKQTNKFIVPAIIGVVLVAVIIFLVLGPLSGGKSEEKGSEQAKSSEEGAVSEETKTEEEAAPESKGAFADLKLEKNVEFSSDSAFLQVPRKCITNSLTKDDVSSLTIDPPDGSDKVWGLNFFCFNTGYSPENLHSAESVHNLLTTLVDQQRTTYAQNYLDGSADIMSEIMLGEDGAAKAYCTLTGNDAETGAGIAAYIEARITYWGSVYFMIVADEDVSDGDDLEDLKELGNRIFDSLQRRE